jgi:hypothetical protein
VSAQRTGLRRASRPLIGAVVAGGLVVVNSSGRALWASNTVGSIAATGSTVAVENTGSFYVGTKRIYAKC